MPGATNTAPTAGRGRPSPRGARPRAIDYVTKLGLSVEYVRHPFVSFVDPRPFTRQQWSDEK